MIIFIFYIFFTCLGTSLPDLFASKNAAQNEQYADAAVGNVTGSNGVNVFLGLGIPWIIATIYHKVNVSQCNVNILFFSSENEHVKYLFSKYENFTMLWF